MPRSDAPPSGDLDVFLCDADNAAARWRNVFMQVRTGKLDLIALQQMVRTARLMRATVGGNYGGVAILEQTAEVPPRDVLQRQRELLSQLLDDQRMRMLVVILGDGLKVTLARAASRAMSFRGNVEILAKIEDVAPRLAAHIGQPPHELTRAVRLLHARAVEAHAKG